MTAGIDLATWLSDWSVSVLTAVLVLVTGFYAWQTRRMVREMWEARRLAVLPKLVIDFNFLGPGLAAVEVRNVGQGPALDADLVL